MSTTATTASATTASDGVPAAGAGYLETIVSEDDYSFSVASAATVLVNLTCPGYSNNITRYENWTLLNPTSGTTVASGSCTPNTPVAVPAGGYLIQITGNLPGNYALTLHI